MKFLILLTFSFIWIASIEGIHLKNRRNATKKTTHKLNSSNSQLNSTRRTPSGNQLKDHFGITTNHSPYGPSPTLLKQKVEIKFNDGKTQNLFENNQLLIHSTSKQCNIKKIKGWEFCFVLNSCDTCTSASNCGWCSLTQRCLPGNLTSSACANYCLKGWKFRRELCRSDPQQNEGVVSGELKGNCETTQLKKVDLSTPKLRVRTAIVEKQLVHTPVLLGNFKISKQINYTGKNNETIFTKNFDVVQPLLGEVHSIQDVQTEHQQIIDLNTGKLIPDPSKQIEYHGIE